jgi:hypothetical protein
MAMAVVQVPEVAMAVMQVHGYGSGARCMAMAIVQVPEVAMAVV